MAMKYTRVPKDAAKNIQMNAGILCSGFDPTTGEVTDVFGATTGGFKFADKPEYTDFFEDVDNAPKNTKEGKQITSREITVSGTYVSVTSNLATMLIAAADGADGHIVPRDVLKAEDFKDMWLIGDYSDVNTGDDAGYLAVHLKDVLNVDGFQMQTTDKSKGTFAFNFMSHYSMENPDVVPYEIYMKGGTPATIETEVG